MTKFRPACRIALAGGHYDSVGSIVQNSRVAVTVRGSRKVRNGGLRVAAEHPRSRAAPIRATLPVIPVANRGEMGILLARHGRLLREYARRYLGAGTSEDEVEDTVERATNALLEAGDYGYPHGLRHATQQLWRECQRTLQERASASDVPVDRRIGPINAQARRILERLGPRSRESILRAAQGWTPEQQAAADNTSVGTINIRLHRARRRFLQLKAELGSSAGAAFLLGRRVRYGAQRVLATARRAAAGWAGGGCVEPISQLAAAAVLAAAGLPAATTAAAIAAPSHGLPSPRAAAWLQLSGTPSAKPGTNRGSRPRVVTATPPATRPSVIRGQQRTGSVLVGVLPGDETPEDTQLMTAAVAANYASTHVILALGVGNTCGCPVLFQSSDGGASWVASPTALPSAAEQIALPPSYPLDPRIFIGTNPQSAPSAYVMPHFGAPATPLPGPPGHLALSTNFGYGDDRVFVAGQAIVVSVGVDATPPTVTPLLTYPGWLVSAADVETPSSADGADVLVLAPQGTAMVGSPSAGQTSSTALFACYEGTKCSRRSSVSAQAVALSTSSTGIVTTVSGGTNVWVSQNGGSSFGVAPPSPSGGLVRSIGTTEGRIWEVTAQNGITAVGWLPVGGAGWHDVTVTSFGLTRSLRLFAVPGGPILDFLVGRGLRCTDDGGATWADRCP